MKTRIESARAAEFLKAMAEYLKDQMAGNGRKTERDGGKR